MASHPPPRELTAGAPQPRPPYANQPTYLQNGTSGAVPGAQPLLPNNGRIIQSGPTRVLCIADVRGNLRSLNELAKTAHADYILHTGDFGFYDDSSLDRIAEKTLRHVAQYSPLISETVKRQITQPLPGQGAGQGPRNIKQLFSPDQLPLSELPQLLNKQFSLDVPVYTVWGACEDVRVLERFRSGQYKVDNLHIIDELSTRPLEVGGVKLRILGLGGAVVVHKLFDNGEGKTYIAGGQGTMWTTLLQIGALIDTANRVYDPSETRIFLTHASPARDGLLNQLSVTLKADFSISAGLHFRYGSSYNEFSVNPSLDHYRGKLAASKASFNDVWETVKQDVEQAIETNHSHKALLGQALDIVDKMPTSANGGNPFGGPVGGNPAAGQVDESAFKNMWNFNLADAAFGYLVLEIDNGRIGTEMRAQGFNFAHRGVKPYGLPPQPATTAQAPVPPANAAAPTGPAQNRQPVFSAPAQPFPQPPRPQQQPAVRPGPSQAQPTKTGTPPATASPAPSSTQANKTAVSSTPLTAKAEPTTNGTSADKATDSEASKAKPATPPAKPASFTALYVSFIESEAQIRDYLAEEDRNKIKSITTTRVGKFNTPSYKVQFESHEIAAAALKRVQEELARRKKDGGKQPKFDFFHDRASAFRESHPSQTQSGSFRAASQGTPGAVNSARGSYQSGGASDSEGGNRGRAGLRSRGGRGGREDRGGRGPRGGRSAFHGKEGESKAAEAAKPSAAESKAD
ncbi:hypothetical protein DV736_g1201, partial [Chaetothyriales sp. CBS 134916]